MLSKHDSIQRDQLEMITLDQLVPPKHLVRKMKASINLKKIANWTWQDSKMAHDWPKNPSLNAEKLLPPQPIAAATFLIITQKNYRQKFHFF